jgi:DNA-binding FrmR family transcriptional regulator
MKSSLKKSAINRLHRLAGQIRGLEKMVQAGKYCPEILVQSLAAQRSLAAFNQVMMENHLREHVIKSNNTRQQRVIAELMRLYKLSNPSV